MKNFHLYFEITRIFKKIITQFSLLGYIDWASSIWNTREWSFSMEWSVKKAATPTPRWSIDVVGTRMWWGRTTQPYLFNLRHYRTVGGHKRQGSSSVNKSHVEWRLRPQSRWLDMVEWTHSRVHVLTRVQATPNTLLLRHFTGSALRSSSFVQHVCASHTLYLFS